MDFEKIRSERQFKSSTGYNREEFEKLYLIYEEVFHEKYGSNYEKYVEENVTELPKFKNLRQSLFFVLFQLKNDMIFDSLGAVFEMDGSTAHYNFKKYLKLVEKSLKKSLPQT